MVSEMRADRDHVERTDRRNRHRLQQMAKWSERFQGEEKGYELQHIFLT
jgi:hypothetical protein